MNAIILISVISIGNSGVYGGSRTLCALSEQGYAPKFFSYIDKSGRPLFATIAILLCGAIGYVNAAASGPTIFDWLLALSGLAALFTWGSICVAHIRFRAAWKHHGHTLDEIPFKAAGGVWGSWFGLILIILVLAAQVSVPSIFITRFSLTQYSSIPPCTLWVTMASSAQLKIGSRLCLHSQLSSSSGLVGICGSELDG